MAKLTIPEIILALFFVDKPYANVNCITTAYKVFKSKTDRKHSRNKVLK